MRADKRNCASVRRQNGFSYAETLMVMLILGLCSGFICDAMSFGLGHLRSRTQRAYAVILLDTLCAAVRNDLQYATEYNSGDNSFTRTDNGGLDVIIRYKVGQWPTDSPENCAEIKFNDESELYHGQIIRESKPKLTDNVSFEYVAPPECYSGYGEVESGLYAGMNIDLFFTDESERKIDRFVVTVRIYDSPDSAADVVTKRRFSVFPVQPVPVSN